MRHSILLLLAAILVSSIVSAQVRRLAGGIKGSEAPHWEVDAWENLPKGKESLEISDFKGKTIYLYCFQSWCPGCHSHGFPTMKSVRKEFADDDGVVFLAVQTVFEGHGTNTMERGLETLKKFDLDIPLGLSGSKERPSRLMRSYKTRGTPWTIIIGKDGNVLSNGFRIDADEAIKLIKEAE